MEGGDDVIDITSEHKDDEAPGDDYEWNPDEEEPEDSEDEEEEAPKRQRGKKAKMSKGKEKVKAKSDAKVKGKKRKTLQGNLVYLLILFVEEVEDEADEEIKEHTKQRYSISPCFLQL